MTDVPAIPAATLIVMRPALPGAPELLLVQRAATMAFAGGAIVFPGGRVDEGDRELAERLGRPDDAPALTAIRETLEESAIPVGLGMVETAQARDWQDALVGGEPFARLLEREGRTPDLSALTPFARWMPAFKQPRRFDTIFYLAEAPAGPWTPHPQPGECIDALWSSAASILDRIERGDASAIFPTKRNLERLAQHADPDAARADAMAHSLETIIPWVEEIDGVPHVRIPADRGYPVTSEPLTSAIRA